MTDFYVDQHVGIKGTEITGHIDFIDSRGDVIDIRTRRGLYCVPPELVEPAVEAIPEPLSGMVVAFLAPDDNTGVMYRRRATGEWFSGRTAMPWQALCEMSYRLVAYGQHQVLVDKARPGDS